MGRKQVQAARLDAVYREGVQHHQAGRLDQARERYQQVLAAQPGHFDALHLLGVYCIQTGQLEVGVKFIEQAIGVRRDVPDAYGNLANALNRLHRPAEALAASDRAIALRPGFAEAHGNRGQALQTLGRCDEALASYERVAALKPAPLAHFNCAAVLRQLGRLDEAVASCGRAIALKPDYVEAHRSLGVVLCDLGRAAEALKSFDQALAVRPDYADAWVGRGIALRSLGRPAEALASQDQALSLSPGHAEALTNRVADLRALQRHDEALAAADLAVSLWPRNPQAHNVRGVALYQLRRLEAALESYDRAIAIDPALTKAHSNQGLALFELRRFGDAMASYDRAIDLEPDLVEAQHNQSLNRLMLGDYAAGWSQYEWRWRTDEMGGAAAAAKAPAWLCDADLEGKTILLSAEQGLGDTLQFCRYAAAVARLGARVILEVQPGLERLMGRLAGPAQLLRRGDPRPEHHLEIPLMSLPLALGSGEPLGHPYLAADPGEAAGWAERLATFEGLRVGLCWAGGARPDQANAHAIDRRRSLPLAAFAPLAQIEAVQLFSLQKGPPSAQLERLRAEGWIGPEIVDLTAELHDWADSAALVANLDLVITADTAMAHLAGALGKPVWILNRFDACWRWLVDRADSPWYASARLFRQPSPGDWESVIAAVAEALAQDAGPRRAPE